MAADVEPAKSGSKPAGDYKARLAACEAEIEDGLRAPFKIGRALAEIRGSQLFRLKCKTFEAYVAERWDMNLRGAERAMEAAAVVAGLEGDNLSPKLPLPAVESHARALAAVRMELRAGVWERAVEQTGGRPTAKAVELAGRELTAAYDAAGPVTAEEKAVHAVAYEAAKAAGGGFPVYDRAGREAVMAYRREHPAAPDKPEQTAGKPGKVGKPSVPAGEPVIDSSGGEDSEPGPVREPGRQVSGRVTGTGSTSTSGSTSTDENTGTAEPDPEPPPCPGCRNLEAKLETAHAEVERLRAAHPDVVMAEEIKVVTAQRDALQAEVTRLSDALRAAAPGNGTPAAADTADSVLSEPDGQPEPGGPCQHPSGCGNRGVPARAERVDGSGKSWTGLLCGDCYGREEAKGGDLAWSRPAEKVSA